MLETDVLAIQHLKHNKKLTKTERGIGNTLDWGWTIYPFFQKLWPEGNAPFL